MEVTLQSSIMFSDQVIIRWVIEEEEEVTVTVLFTVQQGSMAFSENNKR